MRWLSVVVHDPARDHAIMAQPAQPAKCDHVIGSQQDGGIDQTFSSVAALAQRTAHIFNVSLPMGLFSLC